VLAQNGNGASPTQQGHEYGITKPEKAQITRLSGVPVKVLHGRLKVSKMEVLPTDCQIARRGRYESRL
jgi:hypothetical protein